MAKLGQPQGVWAASAPRWGGLGVAEARSCRGEQRAAGRAEAGWGRPGGTWRQPAGPWAPSGCAGEGQASWGSGARQEGQQGGSPLLSLKQVTTRPLRSLPISAPTVLKASEAECRARWPLLGASAPGQRSPPLWNPSVSCESHLLWLFLSPYPQPRGLAAPLGRRSSSPGVSPTHTPSHLPPAPPQLTHNLYTEATELKATAWILSHCSSLLVPLC